MWSVGARGDWRVRRARPGNTDECARPSNGMAVSLALQVGSGLTESAAQAATVAGSVVLVLMLVALGGFAYKSLKGDGIEWPDDVDEEDHNDDSLRKGGDDDDWKYY